MKRTPFSLVIAIAMLLPLGCALPKIIKRPFEREKPAPARPEKPEQVEAPPMPVSTDTYRRIRAPFKKGTEFLLPEAANPDKYLIHENIGLNFLLDLNVPYGTKVLAVESGKVIQVWEPHTRGGCDPTWENANHFIRIKHRDGSIAQYSHIRSKVRRGQRVKKGQIIAVTNKDGFICMPQLSFGVFKSERHLANSPLRQTLPLYFEGVSEGVLKPGQSYKVKK